MKTILTLLCIMLKFTCWWHFSWTRSWRFICFTIGCLQLKTVIASLGSFYWAWYLALTAASSWLSDSQHNSVRCPPSPPQENFQPFLTRVLAVQALCSCRRFKYLQRIISARVLKFTCSRQTEATIVPLRVESFGKNSQLETCSVSGHIAVWIESFIPY